MKPIKAVSGMRGEEVTIIALIPSREYTDPDVIFFDKDGYLRRCNLTYTNGDPVFQASKIEKKVDVP